MFKKKYLIISTLLMLAVSISLIFNSHHKDKRKNEISFYESKKAVGTPLAKNEINILRKFKSENKKCFDAILEKDQVRAIKNIVNKEIAESSGKRIKIKISELEKVLGFDPKPVMKKISHCNFYAKKSFSKTEKSEFKSAMKKLKMQEKVELYNGVAK